MAAESTEGAAPSTEKWESEHDQILVDWADKAMCYRWLHNRENEKYSRKNMWFTIPVIVISTITGTANFAQEHFPEHRSTMSMVIGSFNIVAAIITTVSQFLKIAEVNESHRVATISWDKFYRNVRLTLTRNPRERLPVAHQLKAVKEEFDRMMELSPPISSTVVQEFQAAFSHKPEYDNVIKPDICGNLRTTQDFVYRPDPECPENNKQGGDAEGDAAQEEDPEGVFRQNFRAMHNRSPLEAEMQEFRESNTE